MMLADPERRRLEAAMTANDPALVLEAVRLIVDWATRSGRTLTARALDYLPDRIKQAAEARKEAQRQAAKDTQVYTHPRDMPIPPDPIYTHPDGRRLL